MANIQSQNSGLFIPTTNVWDVSEIYSIDVTSEAFKELLVRLYQNINNIALAVNLKDSGYYVTQEFVNGQAYFPNPDLNSTTAIAATLRQVYRKVVNFGVLPDTTTKSVPHGITCTTATSFTRIYACATDPMGFNYIPIPYASNSAGDSIELNVDGTNVNITTGSDRTNFTITYVVLEYIQS